METTHNQLTYSVTEISTALKRMVEDNFGLVRVRGEISGWKVATSGHAYLKLKDENALLDAVSWKGTVSRLKFKPEDGLEVICTGKLTTYPGRSNYQIVIESMEVAGAGALMALLEKRKAMLAAEGLFDAQRKKPLPFMPKTIGVITSPTGAVIRDILHRLSDRFPCHVMVWGVAVQGEGAAQQIAAAIEGFNRYGLQYETSDFPVPDIIIVARGGGSLEDLWAFNEEVVVRAVAASLIPVISAVGHETDTTLIDYVADLRAPTPTAAAEMAVPVREELILTLMDYHTRQFAGIKRFLQQRDDKLEGLARGLPNPVSVLQNAAQKLDDWSERFVASMSGLMNQKSQQLTVFISKLPNPVFLLQHASQRSSEWSERLAACLPATIAGKRQNLAVILAGLQTHTLIQAIKGYLVDVAKADERMHRIMLRNINEYTKELYAIYTLLESLNPLKILERGFVMVRDGKGTIIPRADQMQIGTPYQLVFFDDVKTVKEVQH